MPSVSVRGIDVYYRDAGSGPGVVLAHSSCSTGGQWAALMDQLSGRYRVLAPDLIGYGRTSGWPRGRPSLQDDEAAILLAVAELAGGKAHFIGHSYGGRIALLAALQSPGAVATLTLLDPVCFLALRGAGETKAYTEIRDVGQAVTDLVASERTMDAAEGFVRYWLGDKAWEGMPPERRAGLAQSIRKNALEFSSEWQEGLTGFEQVATLGMPTLVVGFSRSPLPMRRTYELLKQNIPGCEAVCLDRLGHMAPVLNPATVNPAIVAFLDRHRGVVAG